MNTSAKQMRLRYRPWSWLGWALAKITSPVSPGLWVANIFFQRILRISGEIPWMVHFTSTVFGNISIGRNVEKSFAVSGGCYIQGINGIEIGDDTIFAPGIKMVSANHSKENHHSWDKCEPIRIGKRCWIAANVVILPSVQLGDDVIVGAGAVVTKSFPSGVTIAGTPARILRKV